MTNMTVHSLPSKKAVEMLLTADLKYRPGWKPNPYLTSPTFGVLIYATSGSGIFSVDDQLYPLAAGECFWIPPDSTVPLRPIEGDSFIIHQFRFSFHDSGLRQQMQAFFPVLKVDASLKAMLTYLFDHWNIRDAATQLRVEAISITILNLLSLDRIHQSEPESRLIITEGFSPATKKTLCFLESNIYPAAPYTLEDLGRELGYNKNYLCTVFSKELGISITEYKNFLRIRLAAAFFFFSWYVGIAETSERLRFNSLSYFSRTFKKFVGISPNDFFRACTNLTFDDRSFIVSNEPVYSFRSMTINDYLDAVRHLGTTMKEILRRKADR